MKYSAEYELAMAHIIITTAPYAPHFASEMWSKFVTIPNRLNQDTGNIDWDKDVLQQRWPKLDDNYEVNFDVKVGH